MSSGLSEWTHEWCKWMREWHRTLRVERSQFYGATFMPESESRYLPLNWLLITYGSNELTFKWNADAEAWHSSVIVVVTTMWWKSNSCKTKASWKKCGWALGRRYLLKYPACTKSQTVALLIWMAMLALAPHILLENHDFPRLTLFHKQPRKKIYSNRSRKPTS